MKKSGRKNISVLFAVVTILKNAAAAEAKGVLADGQISGLFSIFKDMTNIYIKIAYGLIVILFAVGAVKSGLSAQFTRQFGMASRLSNAMSDFIICVLIFILGILSYPFIEAVVNRVVASAGTNITGLSL